MNNWMRRRIERSRARCEKAATKRKPAQRQEAEKLSELNVNTSLEGEVKED